MNDSGKCCTCTLGGTKECRNDCVDFEENSRIQNILENTLLIVSTPLAIYFLIVLLIIGKLLKGEKCR